MSTPAFNARTTGDEVIARFGSDVRGKHVIITGSNVGLGLETARCLASAGACVVVACRSQSNADKAAEEIKQKHPDANVTGMQLDLSDLSSVQAFARAYIQTRRPLHILINNAGVMACPLTYTKDGFETQFGVNHIGHFALTTALWSVLASSGTSASPARVITLSSMGNWLFAPAEGIPFDNLDGKKEYDPWVQYGISKLANILFAKEVDRRAASAGQNIIGISLHPGVIFGTSLMRHSRSMSANWKMVKALWRRSGGIRLAVSEPSKTIPQGVSTTLVAALSPDVVRGAFYSHCQLNTDILHDTANDAELAAKLWAWSEEAVKKHMS